MIATAPLRFYIKTFGCRLNQAESDSFTAQLASYGWHPVARDHQADVVIIHSCAITHTAEQEALRLCRRLTRLTPPPFIVLSGCVTAAASLNKLTASGASLIVNRTDRPNLAQLVLKACADLPSSCRTTVTPAPPRTRPLLQVQDGCNFFCNYCIVPHTRGGPISRPLTDCLAEASTLIANGAREIVVTGCNTACYQDGHYRLPQLIEALVNLPGLARLRLSSIEPGTVERDIADLMARYPLICRQLHLPLQSGDNTTLRSMGRRYTSEAFRESITYALGRVPDLGLGTDIITGFPGESAAHHANTRQLITDLPFSNLHVFPYSERQGTPAATMANQIAPELRKQRAAELIAIGQTKRHNFARSFIGKPVTTIIERFASDGTARGWSSSYLPCHVAGLQPAAINTLVSFTPTAVKDDTLIGLATAP